MRSLALIFAFLIVPTLGFPQVDSSEDSQIIDAHAELCHRIMTETLSLEWTHTIYQRGLPINPKQSIRYIAGAANITASTYDINTARDQALLFQGPYYKINTTQYQVRQAGNGTSLESMSFRGGVLVATYRFRPADPSGSSIPTVYIDQSTDANQPPGYNRWGDPRFSIFPSILFFGVDSNGVRLQRSESHSNGEMLAVEGRISESLTHLFYFNRVSQQLAKYERLAAVDGMLLDQIEYNYATPADSFPNAIARTRYSPSQALTRQDTYVIRKAEFETGKHTDSFFETELPIDEAYDLWDADTNKISRIRSQSSAN